VLFFNTLQSKQPSGRWVIISRDLHPSLKNIVPLRLCLVNRSPGELISRDLYPSLKNIVPLGLCLVNRSPGGTAYFSEGCESLENGKIEPLIAFSTIQACNYALPVPNFGKTWQRIGFDIISNHLKPLQQFFKDKYFQAFKAI
jgi:hypothetical protein